MRCNVANIFSQNLLQTGIMGVGKIFSRGANGRFFEGNQQHFSRGAKSGGISFCPLETRKTIFFCQNFNWIISKSRGGQGPCPLSNSHESDVNNNQKLALQVYHETTTQNHWKPSRFSKNENNCI